MLTLRYAPQNGLVLPDDKWDAYIEGLVTQYHHGQRDITVDIGTFVPFIYLQNHVKNGGISKDHVTIIDCNLGDTDIPLDEEGDMLKHNTIGDFYNGLLMQRF